MICHCSLPAKLCAYCSMNTLFDEDYNTPGVYVYPGVASTLIDKIIYDKFYEEEDD